MIVACPVRWNRWKEEDGQNYREYAYNIDSKTMNFRNPWDSKVRLYGSLEELKRTAEFIRTNKLVLVKTW